MTPPDWSEPSRQIIVFPETSRQKPTLREALQSAPAGACLVLKPGVYRESLVIEKTLQIRSAGEPDQVEFEALSGPALVINDACVLVAGINLRSVAGRDKKVAAVVEVRVGHLVMEDCDLTSEVGSLIEVKGPRAELTLRRSHLHDGKAGGISFQDGSTGPGRGLPLFPEQALPRHRRQGLLAGAFSPAGISHSKLAGIYVNEGRRGPDRELRHLGQFGRRHPVPQG